MLFKTGLHHLKQLSSPSHLKTFWGADRKISIALYEAVCKDLDAEKNQELAERILLHFADERGAFKRTYSKRFEEFDAEILKLVHAHFSADIDLVMKDAAISDARTAVDLFQQLAPLYPKLDYQASDFDPYIYVIKDLSSPLQLVVSSQNHILEMTYPPFVFNLARSDHFLIYPINRIIQSILYHIKAKPLLQKYIQGKIKSEKHSLICPQAQKIMQEDTRFKLLRHNLLEPFDTSFPKAHILRAMNVLNVAYFTPEQMKLVLSNIFYTLENNGFLITGSNQNADSVVHGGIYQKQNNRFVKLYHSGSGSFVDPLLSDLTF